MIYSVCVIHFGDPALTRACLSSVDATLQRPHECCVVWNGPEAPGEQFAREHSHWRIIEPGANLGFGAGANLGVRTLSRTGVVEAVLLLNNDAWLEPEAPSHLLAALEENPRAALVGPRLLQASTRRIWHDGGMIQPGSDRVRSLRYGVEDDHAVEGGPVEVDFVCGCAPLIRVEAFGSASGFDERFFLYGEDVDLSLRLRAMGWRVVHEARARAWHHGSASVEAEGRPFALYYRLRGRALLLRKHPALFGVRNWSRLRIWGAQWWRVVRYAVSGRCSAARAIRGAIVDARRGRWGRSIRFETEEEKGASR